jgi:hypothetical protein
LTLPVDLGIPPDPVAAGDCPVAVQAASEGTPPVGGAEVAVGVGAVGMGAVGMGAVGLGVEVGAGEVVTPPVQAIPLRVKARRRIYGPAVSGCAR